MMNILAVLAAAVISLFGGAQAPAQQLGTAVPLAPALYDGYLASGISSSATSMTLSTGSLRNGQALSGFFCFTVDNGQPTTEYICGTASSTSVTGLTRGVDVLNPNSSSTSYAYAHRRFASVQISDYPTLQFLVRKANGTDSYDSKLSYSFTSTSTFSSAGDIISKAYADALTYAGAPDASTSTKGIVEIATTAEVIAGTSAGGTSALLVTPNSLHSPTSTATTIVPVTNTSGKLSQGFLDLTQAFSWSGSQTFTGSATHNATTTLASSTIFSSLSSGLLYGNGTSSVTSITPGTSGQLLISNGSSWAAGNISHATSSISATTLTGSTSTLMITVNHGTNATVILNCGAAMTAANQTVNFGLRSSPGSGTLDSCSLGSGTGAPGGCALNAIVTPSPSATSSSYYINNSNANNGVGSCIAFTL